MVRLMKRTHEGFTFVELMIALGVGAIILAAFTSVFEQTVRTVRSNNDRVSAIRNLDVAGAWFVRDLQPAQVLPATVTIQPGSGNVTIIQSVENTADATVVYEIAANGDLNRSRNGTVARIAEHIASLAYVPGTASTPSRVEVTATVGTATMSKTFQTATRITDANSVLTIVTDSLPDGDEGIPYDVSLIAYGGTGPYTWSISSGALPGWATLRGSTGVIEGANPALGTTFFTVRVTDSVGATADRALSITIVPKPHDISYAPSPLPTANIGVTYLPVTFSVQDGTLPKLWVVESGSLPTGLTISSLGVLSGIPLAGAETSSFTVRVTDGQGVSVTSGTLWIAVNGPLGVRTLAATNVENKKATLNGLLTGLGSATSATVSFAFQEDGASSWKETTSSTMAVPGFFSAVADGLNNNKTYHFKAKVVANGVTVWGAVVDFKT